MMMLIYITMRDVKKYFVKKFSKKDFNGRSIIMQNAQRVSASSIVIYKVWL